MIALGHGLASGVRGEDDGRSSSRENPYQYRPWPGRFDVQVVVGGRPLPKMDVGGEWRVEAVPGTVYDLRLGNPLPERVAVAVSVDGLNVIDAQHTTAWDASKWVVHPYGTLTISGWQVGTERARQFYFTTERDAYATRIGRPGDFGVISAAFYRERRPRAEIVPHRMAVPERRGSTGAEAEPPATGMVDQSVPDHGVGSERRRRSPPWPYNRRAATGIGRSVRSEVREVSMELERFPVAVVTVRYDFGLPIPRPLVEPGFAPEPAQEPGSQTPWHNGRFAPEP
jgi:hypothetical protein